MIAFELVCVILVARSIMRLSDRLDKPSAKKVKAVPAIAESYPLVGIHPTDIIIDNRTKVFLDGEWRYC